MAKLVALVTGANKGIGFAITECLARKLPDFTVLMGARNEKLGLEALNQLHRKGLKNIHYQHIDLSDEASIMKTRDFLKANFGGLDILVNNAGVAVHGDAFDESVAKFTVGTNYFGTVRVCELLVPIVRSGGKVVNVSSTAGLPSKLQPNLRSRFVSDSLTKEELDLLMEKFVKDVATNRYAEEGWPKSTYATSKIGETAYTKILAKRFPYLVINACCPGYVKTDMSSHRGTLTPEQGAETPVHLALLPPHSPSGLFWKELKQLDWAKM